MRTVLRTGIRALLCCALWWNADVRAGDGAAASLFQSRFKAGPGKWQKVGNADYSPLSRTPGHGSLRIAQWADTEQNSSWTSPPLANPGGPVTISFWAADNYLKQTDFSYAAVVDAVDYDAAGKKIATTWYLKSIPWDDTRKTDMWGILLPTGLVWRYYQAVYTPKGHTFRLLFHWRKPIVRGDCYLTDVAVSAGAATPAEPVKGSKPEGAKKRTRFQLEVTTPATDNLFYPDDPLVFDFLLYTRDQAPIGELKNAVVRYEITDFQHLFVARGKAPFNQAKPLAPPDSKIYRQRFMKKRVYNLHQSLRVTDAAAMEKGREFFFRAELMVDGRVLATDTAPYAVLDPFRPDPKDYGKCRFAASHFQTRFTYSKSRHKRQSVDDKTGISWTQVYDYRWKQVQPKYPGPYKFGKPLPAFPRVTFCPNIEQERVQVKWIRNEVPPECVIPDPLHPGRVTFKIKPYVQYIVAWIRHNRAAVARVVPSGLERSIDARTIELHRQVYKAIKAEWPDLPVGMMLYGLSLNPSTDVDLFIKNKLYECADFIDTHIYASSVDWTEWERLQAFYRRKLKREPPPLLSTEFCRVGGLEQEARSRNMIAANLDAFAHGMFSIYYFNVVNKSFPMKKPFLRAPTDMDGAAESGFLYLQWVQRQITSDAVTPSNPYAKRGRWDTAGCSFHPLLPAIVYANLVRNFETAAYRATFHPSKESVAYVFDRGSQTTCALWLQQPVASQTIAVHTRVPFIAQDLFGRTQRLTPRDGVALISIDENPLTLIFDQHVPLYNPKTRHADLTRVDGGLTLNTVARGSAGRARLVLPPLFHSAFTMTATGAVDATWPSCAPQSGRVRPNTGLKLDLPFHLTLNRAVGRYPFRVRLSDRAHVFGLLGAPLQVDELLQMQVTSRPMTRQQDPAIVVSLVSLRDQPSSGVVRLVNPFFALGLREKPLEQAFHVGPRGKTSVRFPVPRDQVNLTTAYTATAEVVEKSGIHLRHSDEIAFRATPHAPGRIVIDGDLSDWQLDKQLPIPFARQFTTWGKPWGGKQDLWAKLYTLWDQDFLYFAVVVRDNSAVSRHNDVSIWIDDNIMLGLYPWGWQKGTKLHSGYYREQLGLCKDGKARIFRVGNVSVGPTTAAGAKIAVTRTKDGYIYEWAYPKACVAPMNLAPGGRFRLSLFVLDTDHTADPKKPFSKLGGVQIGGFNENVNARPERWREFILLP